MVHIPFDTRSVEYHYAHQDEHHQVGGGIGGIGEEGAENNNIPPQFHYFRGSAPYQRGYGFGAPQRGAGIGDVLRGLWRMLMPLARRAGTAVGREALSTGERIMNKMAEGESLKQAAVSEGKRGVDTLLEKSGIPKQFGTGLRRLSTIKGPRKRRRSSVKFSHQTLIGPPPIPSIKSSKTTAPTGSTTTTPNNSNHKRNKRQRSDTFGFY